MDWTTAIENVVAREEYLKEMAMIKSTESYRNEVEKARSAFAELVVINDDEEWNGIEDWLEIALVGVIFLIITLVLVLIPVIY